MYFFIVLKKITITKASHLFQAMKLYTLIHLSACFSRIIQNILKMSRVQCCNSTPRGIARVGRVVRSPRAAEFRGCQKLVFHMRCSTNFKSLRQIKGNVIHSFEFVPGMATVIARPGHQKPSYATEALASSSSHLYILKH